MLDTLDEHRDCHGSVTGEQLSLETTAEQGDVGENGGSRYGFGHLCQFGYISPRLPTLACQAQTRESPDWRGFQRWLLIRRNF